MAYSQRQDHAMSDAFARDPANAVPAVDRIPPGLLQRTATFLSHHDRFVAALVSRSWRSSLLHAPLLWCKVSLCPRTRGDLEYVVEALQELLGRSQGLPLTVELSLKADQDTDSDVDETYFEDPSGAFKHEIPLLLVPQMARIKSLSLQIHEWSGTGWENLFKVSAPLLERFYLAITCGEDDEPLPDNLFNNVAPMLREVLLDWAVLPENPGPAFAGLTSFYYDHAHFFEESHLRLIASWPNLQDLTIGADSYLRMTQHVRGARLRRLQMWHFCDAQTVLDTFPEAQHVCFSARLEVSDVQEDPVNPQLLVSAIRAKGAAQVIEIGYREQLFPEAHVDDKADFGWAGDETLFAVRLDGHDVVVDLRFSDLGRLLPALPVESLIRNLRYLAVPQQLFPLFDVDTLPALEALTLYLGPLPANAPRPAPVVGQRAHRVGILHMVRVLPKTEDRLPPSSIQVPGLVDFIQTKLTAGVLRRIVLEGFVVATAEEYQLLRGIVPEVLFLRGGSGLLEDDDCGPWKWWFPTEDALRI